MDLSRTIGKLFVSNIGKGLVILAGTVYFSQELGGAAFAPFLLFEAILALLTIPADLGLRGAVEKRISSGESARDVVATAVLLKAVPLLGVSLAILIFHDHINRYLGAELALLLVITLIFHEFGLLTLKAIQGQLRVEVTAPIQFSRYAVWFGLGVVLIHLGWGMLAPVYSFLAGTIVVVLWGGYDMGVGIGRPKKHLVRSLVRYAKYNAVSHIGGRVYDRMDLVMLAFFVSPMLVTAYELAWRVSMTVMMFAAAVSTTIFPQVSSWDAEESSDRIESLIPGMLTCTLLVAVPAFFGTTVYAREIMHYLFGSEFEVAWLVLVVLMAEKILQAIHSVLGRCLQAIDYPDLAARATVIAVVLNFGLNIVLISKFGMLGAATATALSFSVNAFLHASYLSRFLVIDFRYRELLAILLAACLMCLPLLLFQQTVRITSLLKLGAGIAVGVVTFIGCSLVLPSLRPYFVRTANAII